METGSVCRRAPGVLGSAALLVLGCASHALAQPSPSSPGGGGAGAMTLPMEVQWTAREFQPGVQAQDEGRDIVEWPKVSWESPTATQYVYATGYVTESPGTLRFATYRYLADHPGPLQTTAFKAFYPEPAITGQIHRAVAMDVDQEGNVYVVGDSERPGGGGSNMLLIKYNSDLEFQWSRRYPESGTVVAHAADVSVHEIGGYVIFTGTADHGSATGEDIVTIAVETATGARSGCWPAHFQHGNMAGVRIYNNPLVNGADRACEIGSINIAGSGEGQCTPLPSPCTTAYLQVAITGTSYGGPALGDDIVTLVYTGCPDVDPVLWEHRFDQGCGKSEVATGLTESTGGPKTVFVSGYVNPCAESAPDINDYLVVAYTFSPPVPPTPELLWSDIHDFFGGNDVTSDIKFAPHWQVVVVGRASNGAQAYDAGLLRYTHIAPTPPNYVLDGTHVFGIATGTHEHGVAVALHAPSLSGLLNMFVTGRTTYGGIQDFNLLLYKLGNPAPPTQPYVAWWTLLGTGDREYDSGHAVTFGSQVKPTVYVTGAEHDPASGRDFFTVAYKQN